MVPYQRSATMPLLPYEKQLIQALGCTEEEYREFVQQAERRAYVRPAGYEHIPDIRMDPLTLSIISLVVGIALSAVSYLLTPKPKAPAQIRQQQLGGTEGASSYSPTQGFESIQNLADYGRVVPIAFTLRQQQLGGSSTGGLVIAPSMVWSRMKSWGGFQVFEMVVIAGQGRMDRPDRAGLFLGNNALDAVFDDMFQFYWNNGEAQSDSRLRGRNLRFGTLSLPAPPPATEDAFVAPTSIGANDTGFSGTFTPSNQTKFGVYAGIPNGTPYRPNWEIIQPLKAQDREGKDQAITNQQKFIDSYVRDDHPFGGGRASNDEKVKSGMPGTGRNYGRHVGIVSHNGYSISNPVITVDRFGHEAWSGRFTEERIVNKNDIIEVYVGYGRQIVEPFPRFGGSKPTNLEDIRSAKDAEAVQFDRALSRGTMFMIGRSVWQVAERPNREYTAGDPHIVVRMKCVEAWGEGARRIGLVAKLAVEKNTALPNGVDIDETYYPILKVEFGSVKNTRPCEVTEIGIKSQSWVRFNGITNFNTIPTAFELSEFNRGDIQVREGKNTSYARRTSFFALDVRPADSEPYRDYNRNEGFVNLATFAVTGTTPQDLFSFMRVKHPGVDMFEYRLRPFPSSVYTQQTSGNEDIFELNGGVNPFQEFTVNTYMGPFTVGGRGKFIKPRDYFTHPQMAARPDLLGDLIYGQWVQGTTQLELLGVYSNVDNRPADWRKINGLLRVLTGENPYFTGRAVGYEISITGWDYTRDLPTRAIYATLRIRVIERSVPDTEVNKWWEIVSTNVVNTVGDWPAGTTFAKTSSDGFSEQWRFEYRTNFTTSYVPFDKPISATRIWETYSGIAEVSHYGDLITRSCDNNPEHEIIYVNESLSEDRLVEYKNCAVAGLKLQSGNNFTTLNQLRCYVSKGVYVDLLTDGGNGPSNLLTDLAWYLATNTDTGAGAIIDPSLLDRDQLAATGRYLRVNGLFFDDVIAEPTNLRSWLAEKAPSMLCFVAIKNGKLSVNPALPTNSSNVIANVPPTISGMFTDGNIIEGSLNIEWLELEERQMFQAAVIYRKAPLNKLPQQETVVVRYASAGGDSLPLEQFELPHVTSLDHAVKAAQYFLAVRKHITHTISFQTLPYGLSLAPGDYIMVAVEQSPYSPSNNGIIADDGTVVSVTPLSDGNYNVYYWDRTQPEISEGTLTISGGIAQNRRGTMFSVKTSTVTKQVYQVEAIEVNEEGIVSIKASSFPVDDQGRSLIAADVVATSGFEIIGGGDE